MNKTKNREDQILDYLRINGSMDIKQLSEEYKVSEATARRVASSLSRRNDIIRTHGGIKYLSGTEFVYSFDKSKSMNIDEKKRIAKYAFTLINENDVVFLEAGTTVQQLAFEIADNLKNDKLKNITIFTNSLDNLNILSQVCKVTLIGGDYRNSRRDFTGYISERMIKLLNFNSCFIGSDGIDRKEGITASDIETVRFDELLITRSKKSIILADSSKFSLTSFISYAAVDQVDKIITDISLPPMIHNDFINHKVDITCV